MTESKRHIGLLLIIIGIGLALRLACLTSGAIWLDEGYTIIISETPLDQFLERLRADTHPFLLPLSYRAWTMIIGQSEFAYELLAVLLGTFTIAAIYGFASSAKDRACGLYAAFLLAVSATHVEISQQIRNYALAVLLLIIVCWSMVRWLKTSDRKAWWILVVSSAATISTHYYAAFSLTALWLGLLFCVRSDPEKRNKTLAAGVCSAVLSIPAVLTLFSQHGHYVPWIPAPSVTAAVEMLIYLSSSTPELTAVLSVLATIGAVIMFRTNREVAVLVLAWLLIPPALAFMYSVIERPIFYFRYMVLLLPAYLVLAAYGMAICVERWQRVTAVVAIVLLSMVALGNYYRSRLATNVDKVAYQAIASNAREGDVVLHMTKCSFVPAKFYLRDSPEQFMFTGSSASNIIRAWLPDEEREISIETAMQYKRLWIYDKYCGFDQEERKDWPPLAQRLGSESFESLNPRRQYYDDKANLYRFDLAE